jgi:hypothetical protein
LRSKIRSVRLTQLPDHVLIDSSAAKGEWGGDVVTDKDDYIGADVPDDFAADGDYRLEAQLTDGSSFSRAIHGSGLMADSAPEIFAPRNHPYSLPVPTEGLEPAGTLFRFGDFLSASFQPGEERRLIAFLNFHPVQARTTNFWTGEFNDLPHRVIQPGQDGVPSLRDGEYRFAIDYQESRREGDLVLTREAETVIRFFVAAPHAGPGR